MKLPGRLAQTLRRIMALTWTDWRGNDFTVGDTILYARLSGRSCEMAEGVVEDLFVVWRDRETYKWVRLPENGPVPTHEVWRWRNLETGELTQCGYGGWRDREGFERVQVTEPVDTERRAKIMPTLRTSRFNSYEWGTKKWNEETKVYDKVPRKAVSLTVTESITAIKP
jgi:hypothetical protein